jgi:class 3 adenylate cyclase
MTRRDAIHAALAMRAALRELNAEVTRKHGLWLAMRVGINTGPVLVHTAVGPAGEDFTWWATLVNVASRLEEMAPADGILIAQAT